MTSSIQSGQLTVRGIVYLEARESRELYFAGASNAAPSEALRYRIHLDTDVVNSATATSAQSTLINPMMRRQARNVRRSVVLFSSSLLARAKRKACTAFDPDGASGLPVISKRIERFVLSGMANAVIDATRCDLFDRKNVHIHLSQNSELHLVNMMVQDLTIEVGGNSHVHMFGCYIGHLTLVLKQQATVAMDQMPEQWMNITHSPNAVLTLPSKQLMQRIATMPTARWFADTPDNLFVTDGKIIRPIHHGVRRRPVAPISNHTHVGVVPDPVAADEVEEEVLVARPNTRGRPSFLEPLVGANPLRKHAKRTRDTFESEQTDGPRHHPASPIPRAKRRRTDDDVEEYKHSKSLYSRGKVYQSDQSGESSQSESVSLDFEDSCYSLRDDSPSSKED